MTAAHPALTDSLLWVFDGLGYLPGGMPNTRSRSEEAAAMILGILLILTGVAGAAPLHRLVRESWGRLPGARRAAWGAAILWVHYPALILQGPSLDQTFATLTLYALLLVRRGLHAHPWRCGIALGALFMIGINLSFTLLLLIPLLLVMAALEVARASGARQWKRPGAITSAARPALGRLVRLLAATAAACLAFDVALRAGWGIDLARIFFTALRIQHEHLLPGIDRTYWLWLFYNVYDYLLLAGPALAALGAMYLARAAHRAWHGPRWIVPAWAFFPIAIVLLDLSGLTPAETSRVWLFLAPGMAWAGAAALALRPPRDWRVNLALLLFIQCATLYVMRAHISFISI